MRLRIGVREATKELDLEVEDAQAVVDAYVEAVTAEERLLWITESDGRRYAIVTAEIIYFELEAERHKSVGFSPG